MSKCIIKVNGKEVDRKHNYVVRFFLIGDGTYKPVLYEFGRRVIEDYEIEIKSSTPKDIHGRSG